MRHPAQSAFVAPILAVALLAVSGCASPAPSDSPEQSSAPASDKAFTLYSGRDEELIQPLVDIFEKESGIDVTVRYGDTPSMTALLLEEGENSPAHAFLSQDAGALGALSAANLLTPLPNDVLDAVRPEFSSVDGTWVGVTGRARVIVYDGEALTASEVPSSVDAFTEPEWAGRFGIAPSNASFQSFVTAYRVLRGEEAADAWVAGIAANDPQIFENNRAILAAVDEGTVEAGLINHYYWFAQAAETGEENMRAQLSFPAAGDPGSIVNVSGAGLVSSGEQDADALEFLKFLVSPTAQQYFVDETFEYSLVDGIASYVGLPALESLVNPDLDLADLNSLDATQQLLSTYGLI